VDGVEARQDGLLQIALLMLGYPQVNVGEDWGAWISLTRAGSFGYIPEPLTQYMVRSDSLSNADGRLFEGQLQVLDSVVSPMLKPLLNSVPAERHHYFCRAIDLARGLALSGMGSTELKRGHRKIGRKLAFERALADFSTHFFVGKEERKVFWEEFWKLGQATAALTPQMVTVGILYRLPSSFRRNH